VSVWNGIFRNSGRACARFYCTVAGAEIDLGLDLGGEHGLWAIEIKCGLSVRPQRGFYLALEDLKPSKAFVVYSGLERYPLNAEVDMIGLRELAQMLTTIGRNHASG